MEGKSNMLVLVEVIGCRISSLAHQALLSLSLSLDSLLSEAVKEQISLSSEKNSNDLYSSLSKSATDDLILFFFADPVCGLCPSKLYARVRNIVAPS